MAKKHVKPRVTVELALDKETYKSSDPLKLTFSITNESRTRARVLTWHTPFEGFKGDIFDVESSFGRVPYIGRLVKRGPPTESDYITLAPGRTERVTVDLAEAYDISDATPHSVRYRSARLRGEPVQRARARTKREAMPRLFEQFEIRSNSATFQLAQPRPQRRSAPPKDMLKRSGSAPSLAKDPLFSECSASRKAEVEAALVEATKLARSAMEALVNTEVWERNTAERYKDWFGDYTSGRYTAVLLHMSAIWATLENRSLSFDCACEDEHESSFAYVSNREFPIYLCNAFWNASLSGTDSRAGTIIHEVSHVVASTDDHAYGHSECAQLANSDPSTAIDNADSHEYFAENTPALSMEGVPGSVRSIAKNWHKMPAGFTGDFDAVLDGGGPFSGNCYFFKGDKYVKYSWLLDQALSGYPKKISAGWHGMPAGFTSDFDAVINGRGRFAGKCYFFKGDKYVRYDWDLDRADSAPRKIADFWHGLPSAFTKNLDAVINNIAAGRCHFFKGDSYVAYDWFLDMALPGFPKKIADEWHGMPAGFLKNFDAAVEGEFPFNGKGYFFKGNSYVRYDFAGDFCEP